MEVIVEVEGISPEQQQRAAHAAVVAALLSIYIAPYHNFFSNLYLTCMHLYGHHLFGGQFARNLLLLLGTASGSCSSSTRFRASSLFSSRRSVRSDFL